MTELEGLYNAVSQLKLMVEEWEMQDKLEEKICSISNLIRNTREAYLYLLNKYPNQIQVLQLMLERIKEYEKYIEELQEKINAMG